MPAFCLVLNMPSDKSMSHHLQGLIKPGRLLREDEEGRRVQLSFLIDFSFWVSDYTRQEGSKCIEVRSNRRRSVAQNNKSLCLVLSLPITGCLRASLLTYGVRMMEYTHCCNCSLPCQREQNRTLGHFSLAVKCSRLLV